MKACRRKVLCRYQTADLFIIPRDRTLLLVIPRYIRPPATLGDNTILRIQFLRDHIRVRTYMAEKHCDPVFLFRIPDRTFRRSHAVTNELDLMLFRCHRQKFPVQIQSIDLNAMLRIAVHRLHFLDDTHVGGLCRVSCAEHAHPASLRAYHLPRQNSAVYFKRYPVLHHIIRAFHLHPQFAALHAQIQRGSRPEQRQRIPVCRGTPLDTIILGFC